MRFFNTFVIGALLSGVSLGSPTSHYEVHEKRDLRYAGWSKAVKPRQGQVLPFAVALTQQNLDKGHDWLMEVSDPSSALYGQHWDTKKVIDTFKASDDTVNAVKEWLVASGIDASRLKLSTSKNWLKFTATVKEAEILLKTEYHYFKHDRTGTPHIACDGYSLPVNIRKHIDMITPGVTMDSKLLHKSTENAIKKRDNTGLGIAFSNSPKLVPLANNITSLVSQLSNCATLITPDCLRELYGFLATSLGQPLPAFARTANATNSYGIVEYTPQSYNAADLDVFFRNFSAVQVGQRPTLDAIDGGFISTAQNLNLNAESNLDLQYAMALSYPQNITLYQVGDLAEQNYTSFNNFLDAIDASYCTFEGGDHFPDDAIYPDPLNATGSYKGTENCGTFAPAKVISTSYGYNEADLTPAYEQRQCLEYMKLGLQGTTFFYSSGDYGVAGNSGQCIDPATGQYNNGSSGVFNPSFPSTCPYVTSVGATQVIPGVNVVQAIATGTQPERACETVIYSGGGFSNVFPIPSYQASAVKSWFSNYPPPYTSARFNNSQSTRAFPDISANGANYAVALLGAYRYKLYGTSASSPVLGSIFTLINQARLNAGKSSVGFINPVLYANPSALNDITIGGNQGCGTAGFSSSPGWDPVTGLGTPNFPKLLNVFMALP